MDKPASAPKNLQVNRLTDYLDREDFKDFVHKLLSSAESTAFASFTFPIKPFDPLAALEMLWQDDRFHYFWEKPDQEFSLSAGEQLYQIEASGLSRFADVAHQIKKIDQRSTHYSVIDHSLSGIHFLGGFAFFSEIQSKDWQPFKSASLTIPKWLIIRDGKFGLLTLTLSISQNDSSDSIKERVGNRLEQFDDLFRLYKQDIKGKTTGNTGVHPEIFKHLKASQKWSEKIEKAKELIYKKTFEKIVLARKISWKFDGDTPTPTFALNSLRNHYPSCYNFLIHTGSGASFLGSSPERLVSFRKNYMLTESLAGSISRGSSATEDTLLEKKLLESTKNKREHYFVTSAIQKRLEPFVQKIEAPKNPGIKKLKNVQHLFTPITAWLKKDIDRFAILDELHPTPAVGGFPREKAVPYISQLEHFDRGWYAGPVGWFNLNGGGEFSVAIRSGLVNHQQVTLYAGCGIVEDSDADTEWEETNLKLMPMFSALQYNGTSFEE